MKTLISLIGTLLISMAALEAQPGMALQTPEPTTPASNAAQGIINCHQLKVDFQPGNGNQRIIIMRANAPVDQLPNDSVSYTASNYFGSGQNLGNGNYVVYKGSGNGLVIGGLQQNTNYHYAIFEFNGSGIETNYLTSKYLSLNKQFPMDPQVAEQVEHISCHGADDGSITLEVSGGTTPYAYDWSNGSNKNKINNLEPGSYAYTITDSVGCVVSASITITEPEIVTLQHEKENVSCHGGSDGKIFLQASGGVGDFTYEWAGSELAGDTVEGLATGTYQVTVTDSNGCEATDRITIDEPTPLQVESSTKNASCHDSEDGSIQLTPAGAMPPYDISWSNDDTTFTIDELAAGTYAYTITDANDCETMGEEAVNAPDPLTMEAEIYDISCYGADDGIINIDPAGGTEPYVIDWADGGSGNRDNLSPGDYTAYVTDEKGCTDTMSFSIYEPDSLWMEMAVTDASCEGVHDGAIEVEIGGGQSPYQVSWKDGSTDEDRAYLPTGTYEVTVTDDNGCTISGKRSVGLVPGDQVDCTVQVEIFDIFTPNGDGTNDNWVIKNIQAYPDNQLEIYNRWGLRVYDTQGYQNNWNGQNNAGEELPPGTYYYVLKIFTSSAETFTGSITFLR